MIVITEGLSQDCHYYIIEHHSDWTPGSNQGTQATGWVYRLDPY